MTTTTTTTTLAAGTWTADAAVTVARFTARDLLRRPVVGTLPVVAGRVEVAADGTVASVSAELDLDGVATGNRRRDGDLRGRRFFDVATSPRLLFSAGPARLRRDGTTLLHGDLTMKGVRSPVELHVQRLDGDRVRATATVDRRSLGIAVPHLLVGLDVHIEVDAVLRPPSP